MQTRPSSSLAVKVSFGPPVKSQLRKHTEDAFDPASLPNRAAARLVGWGNTMMSWWEQISPTGIGSWGKTDGKTSAKKTNKPGPLGSALPGLKGDVRDRVNEELKRTGPLRDLDKLIARRSYDPLFGRVVNVAIGDPYEAALMLREWYGKQALAPDSEYHDEKHELRRGMFR